jgi:hypothetical protein
MCVSLPKILHWKQRFIFKRTLFNGLKLTPNKGWVISFCLSFCQPQFNSKMWRRDGPTKWNLRKNRCYRKNGWRGNHQRVESRWDWTFAPARYRKKDEVNTIDSRYIELIIILRNPTNMEHIKNRKMSHQFKIYDSDLLWYSLVGTETRR